MPQTSRLLRPEFHCRIAFANTLIALILLSVFAATPVLAIPAVRSVKIVGTNLAVNLATQEGQPYNARAIEKDVHQLWSAGRFSDIRVEATEEPAGTAVVFRVTPAPDLRLCHVRIEPSSFGLHPKIDEGASVSPLRAHEIALEAQKRLNAEGYLDARVDFSLLPVSRHAADVQLTVRAGKPVDVRAVEFAGHTGLDAKDLRWALRDLRIRRLLPGVPGVWDGWRMFPAYNRDAVDADLNRLRSLYVSKGYFDANVRFDSAAIRGNSAVVRLDVQSGPQYRVRKWTVTGTQFPIAPVHPRDGVLRTGDLCSCLFAARRGAERRGVLDFSAKLDMQRADAEPGSSPAADLTASVTEGRPYRVGRITFTGNRRYRDATVRRNLVLDEGDWLNRHQLRKSIARLNQTLQFEPLDENSIGIRPHPRTGEADIEIRLTERNRRAWSISGPLGTMSFAGPLQASLSSRLPAWGQGVFELSTYAASLSLLAFSQPLLPFLSITSTRHLLLVMALERPFTPGEGWRSGFVIAPQMGWRFPAMSYAAAQLQHRLLPVLTGDRGLETELPVIMDRPQGDATLLCAPPKPRFAALRVATAMLVQFLGAMT
jgi:outer membrane protein insertion porin family